MATMIKDLSQAGTVTFQTQCQAAFDKRWNQFNFDLYYLHIFCILDIEV